VNEALFDGGADFEGYVIHSAIAILLATASLGQIETSRPEVRSLEAKYRVSGWSQGPEHSTWFYLGSPIRVGHWVVFSISKTRGGFGSADFGQFPQGRREPVTRPACLDTKPRSEPWVGLVAYDLDSGRAVQLTPPPTGKIPGRSTWVDAHVRWNADRCAVVMLQTETEGANTENRFWQYVWDWNLKKGTLRPVGDWSPARILEFALDPQSVEVTDRSAASAQKQTFEIRDKSMGRMTQLTTSEPLRPHSNSAMQQLEIFPQADGRSFLLHDLVDRAPGGPARECQIECVDPLAPNGRRWTLTAAVVQQATRQKPDSMRPLTGMPQKSGLVAICASALSPASGPIGLIFVDSKSGKIERAIHLSLLAEGQCRGQPIFLDGGARAAYLETEADHVAPGSSGQVSGSTALITIDTKTGAELSRLTFGYRLSTLSFLLGVDSRGRILIATQDRLDSITLGKSASLEPLFSLDPSETPSVAMPGAGDQRLNGSGAVDLQGARRLNAVVLSRTEVSDAMLVALGQIDGLKHLEIRLPEGGSQGLERSQGLTSLTLSGDTTESVARQLGQLSKLTQLSVTLGRETSAGAIHRLGRLAHLTSFHLNEDFDESFKVKHLRTLKNLTSLRLFSVVNDDDLAALSQLENLTQLDIHADISGAGARHLKKLPRLIDLRLSLNGVGDSNFDDIVTELGTFAHLKRLRLADENTLSKHALARLGGLTTLTQLELGHFGVEYGEASIEGLAACRNLSRLDLTDYLVKADDARELLKLENLKQLDLSGLQDLRVEINQLGRLKNLEELDLYSPQHRPVKLTDGCLADLRGLARLSTLCLSGHRISDAGTPELACHNTLQQLRLAHTQITVRGLKRLSTLEHLADLDLFDTAITDDGLKELHGFRALKALDLGMTQVTDNGMKHLVGVSGLRRLGLQANSITDVGLRDVAAIVSLEDLDLSATDITDAGLAELKRLKNLHTLNLKRTAITDAGLRRLKDLPRLTTLILGR
jgi:internalin A